jgi:hypothetical protein
MPFPAIRHCLICEGTRPEPFGKLSILGFYGVAPDVEIAIKDLRQPLQLGFVFVGSPGTVGQYPIRFEIADEAGQVVVSPPAVQAAVEQAKRMNLNVQLLAVLPRTGRYGVRLFVSDALHYETTFEVRLGRDEDFRVA